MNNCKVSLLSNIDSKDTIDRLRCGSNIIFNCSTVLGRVVLQWVLLVPMKM